jgi:hypothetical protein
MVSTVLIGVALYVHLVHKPKKGPVPLDVPQIKIEELNFEFRELVKITGAVGSKERFDQTVANEEANIAVHLRQIAVAKAINKDLLRDFGPEVPEVIVEKHPEPDYDKLQRYPESDSTSILDVESGFLDDLDGIVSSFVRKYISYRFGNNLVGRFLNLALDLGRLYYFITIVILSHM